MKSYKDLVVWRESMDLAKDVYRVTQNFPEKERYNLTSQIQRSAVSIPSNIAEGHDRKTDKEFVRFLVIAYSSSSELETQLTLAKHLKFLSKEEYDAVTKRLVYIRKMLNSLITRTKSNH